MFSKEQILKAEQAVVSLISEGENGISFNVMWFGGRGKGNSRISEHKVRYKRGLPIRECFICDCPYAMEWSGGEKYCYHVLAVIKYMTDKRMIRPEIWNSIKEGAIEEW